MTSFFNDVCALHIPHKRWADDPREAQNYDELERWSRHLPLCYAKGSGGSDVVDIGPTSRAYFAGTAMTLADNTGGYVTWSSIYRPSLSYGSGFRVNTGTQNLTLMQPGIVTWNGFVNPQIGGLPAFGTWVTYEFNDFNQILQDCTMLAQNQSLMRLGGAAVVPADEAPESLQLRLGQQTGGTISMSVVLYLNLTPLLT